MDEAFLLFQKRYSAMLEKIEADEWHAKERERRKKLEFDYIQHIEQHNPECFEIIKEAWRDYFFAIGYQESLKPSDYEFNKIKTEESADKVLDETYHNQDHLKPSDSAAFSDLQQQIDNLKEQIKADISILRNEWWQSNKNNCEMEGELSIEIDNIQQEIKQNEVYRKLDSKMLAKVAEEQLYHGMEITKIKRKIDPNTGNL